MPDMLIDAHTHVFAPAQRDRRDKLAARDPTFAEMYADPAAKMTTAAELRQAIAAAGFDGAVACGFAFAAQRDIDQQNEHLLTLLDDSSHYAVLATVNPALPGWRRAAEAALGSGARGFGELRPHNQGWKPLESAGAELCELAEAQNAILQWHVSEPVGHTYPGKAGGISPAEVIQIATAHPRLRMVAAHLGGGASFYLQMPEVRATTGNVYFDTAAQSLLYDERSVVRLAELAGTQRVLFASDYPLLSPRRQLERVQSLLSGEVARAICGGNAGSLFFEIDPRRGDAD